MNNEITPLGKSDIVASKDIDKSETKIRPVSTTSELGIESDNPSFNKILVTYDGSKKSDKAINYSIYLSNISKAEIVILQVLGNIDKLENSSIDISNKTFLKNDLQSLLWMILILQLVCWSFKEQTIHG